MGSWGYVSIDIEIMVDDIYSYDLCIIRQIINHSIHSNNPEIMVHPEIMVDDLPMGLYDRALECLSCKNGI